MTPPDPSLPPVLLGPVLLEKPWGGDWLATRMGKPAGPGALVGESWEAVALRGTSNPIASGPGAGGSLGELLAGRGEEILGRGAASSSGDAPLPILFKYLHAVEDLSLQVHPDQEEAVRLSGRREGKTEAWRIIDAEPEAAIWIGCREGVTKESFREALESGEAEAVLGCLQRWPAEPGATYIIRAGTIHTVGRGVLFAEFQEASDLTYRFTDFGRKDASGKSRDLQPEEAFAVADFGPAEGCRLDGAVEVEEAGGVRRQVFPCGPFTFEVLEGQGEWEGSRTGGFEILSVGRGAAEVTTAGGAVHLPLGGTALLPAAPGTLRVRLEAATVLRAYPPAG